MERPNNEMFNICSLVNFLAKIQLTAWVITDQIPT